MKTGKTEQGKPMLERFRDNARRAVKVAFRHERSVSERELIAALAGQRGVAQRLLGEFGVVVDSLPAGQSLDRREVVASAVAESQRCRVWYVGTAHILLAVARRPGSILPRCGMTADRLSELILAAEATWRRAHPPFAWRLGSALRAVAERLRSGA
jgi:hypothetical protein